MLRIQSSIANNDALSRAVYVAALLIMCQLLTGCSLIRQTHHVLFLAKRTTALEPHHFPYLRDEKRTHKLNRDLAKQAWIQFAANNPEAGFSPHYERGFVDGFSDYLFWGGSGEPSLVPPRDYWRLENKNNEGRQAIQDWYEGARHGSRECQLRGYRDQAVVDSSLMDLQAMPAITTNLPRLEEFSSEVQEDEWGPIRQAAARERLSDTTAEAIDETLVDESSTSRGG